MLAETGVLLKERMFGEPVAVSIILVVGVVVVLIVAGVCIVACFRQKSVQNTGGTDQQTRHRRYINRGGRIVLSEFWNFLFKIKSHKIIQLSPRKR